MKKTENNSEEKWLDDLMKEASLDSPASDFTSKVMLQIQASKTTTVYKPLLSKTAWMVILMGFAVVFVFVFNHENAAVSKSRLPFPDFRLEYSTAFEFSLITIYAVVISTVLLLVQMALLNKYFTKQLSKP